LPGRLSVSRTFGDPEAKLEFKNGNPKVVIADPEIKVFQITKQHDYIILACDGIFDKMSNADVNACVWNSCQLDLLNNKQGDKRAAQNVH
jgi:serine/threonine protein phosphatase PrpC